MSGRFCREDAEGGVEGAEFGFAEEQVDVLGHEDVAVDHEAVTLAGGFEDLFEAEAGGIGVQVGETTVAAEGDEVEVAFVLEAFEADGHGAS